MRLLLVISSVGQQSQSNQSAGSQAVEAEGAYLEVSALEVGGDRWVLVWLWLENKALH